MSGYIGCYNDEGDGVTRDLPYNPISNYGALTIELCISACSGYKYAAVQFRFTFFYFLKYRLEIKIKIKKQKIVRGAFVEILMECLA